MSDADLRLLIANSLKAHEIDIDTGRRDIVEPRFDDEEQIIESEQKKPKGIKKIGRVLNRIIA